MTTRYRALCSFVACAIVLAVLGCASTPFQPPSEDLRAATAGSVLRSLSIDRAVEDRILALDPKRIGEDDVRNTLAKGPTPRIFEVHGGVYPVHLLMESFSEFLTGMGFPEDRIRDPGDGAFSRSPYDDSERQAGEIAWYYEHEGVRPMLVGHSQGGIQIVKILHELAGTFGAARRVFNPLTSQFEERTTIVDPLDGRERPVVGVSAAYASVVGTGGWALVLPVHWKVVHVIRSIPDTVDDFTGYRIGVDFFAWDAPGFEEDISRNRKGEGAQRDAARRVFARVRPRDRAARPVSRHARLDQCLRPGRREGQGAAARRRREQHHVGRRRLAQHQRALVSRGAAPDPHQACRARDVVSRIGQDGCASDEAKCAAVVLEDLSRRPVLGGTN